MESQQAITREIARCTKCGIGQPEPFFFSLNNQPIMLISAEPSMQAMYKPLYSIRFFRNLCMALFGDKCLRERGQAERIMPEFCEGAIYWTHYHKCYDASIGDFSEIENGCAEKYLAREMKSLQKSLKYIIVLGDEIWDKVELLTPQELKSLLVFKPFPNMENLEEFEDVRQIIKPYLMHVNKKMVGFNTDPGVNGYVSQTSELEGNSVHLLFELESFEKEISGQKLELDGSIEAVWYKSLSVPNMRRCSLLVQTYCFIETQIKTQISDYILSTENMTMLSEQGDPGKTASVNGALCDIKKNWLHSSLADYVKMLAPDMLPESKYITTQMNRLRLFRNAIVHNGGLLENREVPAGTENLPGIFSFAGTVFVSEKGEKFLQDFVERATKLLCDVK